MSKAPRTRSKAEPVEAQQPDDDVEAALTNAKAETGKLVAHVASFAVTTHAQYEEAAKLLGKVKGYGKRLTEIRLGMTRPLDESKRKIMALFADPLERLEGAERQLKRALQVFEGEQERIRREEQRKADEAADKERRRLEAQAEKAAQKGNTEKAVQLQEKASMTVAPVVSGPPPTAPGISSRANWKFEVTDPALIPREYLQPDLQKIGAVVRALKGDAAIAGVRVFAEKITNARATP